MTLALQNEQDTASREIVVSRLMDARRELVFEAWTKQEHLEHWWGPNGFTTTTQKMDLRPGGQWRQVMHGPDGTDYPNLLEYVDIVPPERIVYKHSGNDDPAADFVTTILFENENGKTRLTMQLLFSSAEARNQNVAKYGSIEGGKQTLGRLARYVESM